MLSQLQMISEGLQMIADGYFLMAFSSSKKQCLTHLLVLKPKDLAIEVYNLKKQQQRQTHPGRITSNAARNHA